MKNWFLISVVMIILGFAVIYLVVNSVNDLELAPGLQDTCENQKTEFSLCTSDIEYSNDLQLLKNICYKDLGPNPNPPPPNRHEFILPTTSGSTLSCPEGYKLSTVGYGVTEGPSTNRLYGICAVVESIAKNGALKEPAECSEDLCVSKKGKVTQSSRPYKSGKYICCSVVKERVCEKRPSRPGEPSPTGTGSITPAGGEPK